VPSTTLSSLPEGPLVLILYLWGINKIHARRPEIVLLSELLARAFGKLL
jgi:hypothetical protein